jgi:hypothetical protein|tara:strand:+ start:14344 stop:14703 length:360 start_codon:yes stop_codon:yes gene_type:complete
MKEVKEDSQAIGEFIEEMQFKGIILCEYVERKRVCEKEGCTRKGHHEWGFLTSGMSIKELDECPNHHHDDGCYNAPHDGHYPIRKSIEKILADYFGIDLNKCEQERRQILEDCRKQNEE